MAKNSKGKHVPYQDGAVCIVTINGGEDASGNFLFNTGTKVTGCDLFDDEDNHVAPWAVKGNKVRYHDGKLTVVFIASDPRQLVALQRKQHFSGAGYIVVTTDLPGSNTDPGQITVEPVNIDPCA